MRLAGASAILLLVLVGACAPQSRTPDLSEAAAKAEAEKQREIAITERVRAASRALRVGHPILKAGVARCAGRVSPQIGMEALSLEVVPADDRSAYEALYGVKKQPTVVVAPAGLPASRAGLNPGDVIVRFDGKTVAEGKAGHEEIQAALAASTRPITVEVRRAGRAMTTTLHPDRACTYPIEVVRADQVNAFANGEKIAVTTGMLRFVENDGELALVIAHELAHNTESHIAMKSTNAVIGGIFGAVLTGLTGVNMIDIGMQLGAGVNSQAFEEEADYVGVYYAAAAGFDVQGAANLWRRMGASHPTAIHLQGSSHPSTAKRFLAIEATAAEIARKKAAGLTVEPERKPVEALVAEPDPSGQHPKY